MNINDERLDQLFCRAREENPVAQFDETRKAFMLATVTAAGGVLATKGILKLLTVKKWIIMFSTVSVISMGALIVGLNLNSTNQFPDADNATEPRATVITERINPKETDLDLAPRKTDTFPDQNQCDLEMETLALLPSIALPEVEKDSFPQKREEEAKLTQSITPYTMRFDVTEKTTKEEFESIKKKAEAAGIMFHYKAHYKNDKITRLTIKVKDEKDGKSTQHITSNMNVSGDFSYTLAWNKLDEGKAADLFWGETKTFEDELRSTHNNENVDWAEFKKECEQIMKDICLDTNIYDAEIERSLAILKSELEHVIDNIDRTEIEESMRLLAASRDDLMQVIRQEMQTACREMEKAMKEAEKSMKEAEKARREAERVKKEMENGEE